jgi:tetratricopeptide (TPR) repeat protein
MRNWIVTGEPVLITAHGGINFYTGNNENATGIYRPPEGMSPVPGAFNLEIPKQVAEKESGRSDMTDRDVSSFWFKKAAAFIRSYPDRFMQLLLKKCFIFFNGYEVELNTEFYFFKNISHALKIAWVPLGLIMPIGLLGMALTFRRWRDHMIFYLFFLCYSLSVVLFFVSARYRLPVVPVLLLYGGFALKTAGANVKRPLTFGLLLLVGAVLAFLVNVKSPVTLNQAILAHNEGYNFAAFGRLDKAIQSYKKALQADPNLASSHINMAIVYKRQGKLEKASDHFKAALRLKPDDHALWQEMANLGMDLFQQGKKQEAVSYFREVLRINGKIPEINNDLGLVLAQSGNFDESIKHLKEALLIDPKLTYTHYNLGLLLVEKGRLDEAVFHFSQAIYINPAYGEAYHDLGLVLVRQGKFNEAVASYYKSLEIKPGAAVVHNDLGIALVRMGRMGEAMKHFKQALKIAPDFSAARDNIRRVEKQKLNGSWQLTPP